MSSTLGRQEIAPLQVHGTITLEVDEREAVTAMVPEAEVWEPRSYLVEVASGGIDTLRHSVIGLVAGGVGITLFEGTMHWAEAETGGARGLGSGVWGPGDVLQWTFWQEGGDDPVTLRYLMSGRRYVRVGP